MNTTWNVMAYEIKRTMNKQFLFMTLVFPILIILISLAPNFLAGLGDTAQRTIAVIDDVGLYPVYSRALEGSDFTLTLAQEGREELERQVEDGVIHGFLVLSEEALRENRIHYYSKDPDLTGQARILKDTLESIIVQQRMADAGIPPQQAGRILQPLEFREVSVGGEEWGFASFIVPFALIMILAISILNTGSVLFYSVINEKKERMVEIILSSTDAYTLLRGKIMAFTCLGLMQLVLWFTAAMVAVRYFLQDLPILSYIGIAEMPLFLLIFLISYVFFASLFAAIGSTMEDAQSAQGITGLIFILPMLPVFFITPLMMNPNGIVARVLTFLPVPGGLMARMAFTSVPPLEIAASIGILTLATVILMYLAGKIFSTGMLMYGKAFSLREVLRWLRG